VCSSDLREVFEHIGLLDEDFFTYFEDVDFCLRAGRAGWPTWYVPESRIVHLVGQSSGIGRYNEKEKRRGAYWFRARRHYFLKNHGRGHAAAADAAAIAGLLLWKARCLIERRHDPDPPCFLRDLIRHSVFVTGFARRPVRTSLTE
jgi:GT2 family glycosyltransferase